MAHGHAAPEHARRWVEASGRGVLVALLGQGPKPLPGVRGRHLDDDDPLRTDLTVVVAGPHVAKALVARPAPDGLLDSTLVDDRALVLEAAHSPMSRIVPSPSSAMPV